jgi:hypothetical protein
LEFYSLTHNARKHATQIESTDLIFGTWNVQIMLQPGKMMAIAHEILKLGIEMRCLDDVSTDLRKTGLNEWRDRAKNRDAWRRFVKEAKTHPLRAVAPPK